MLSKRFVADEKLDLCAFLSRKLSSVERNDMRDCELLAIKVTLKDWHHWLEVSVQQFLVLD